MTTIRWWKLVFWASVVAYGCARLVAQEPPSQISMIAKAQKKLPLQRASRFLAPREITPQNKDLHQSPAAMMVRAREQHAALAATPNDGGTSLTAPWQAVGPSAVQTSTFGLISGRVTSIAVDPLDASGNTVYVGTTGGGVWKSTNAAGAPSSVQFTPLTDTLPVFSSGNLASLSIGALAVQPGGSVILAGTGDSNDATDSYYGTGILRSADGGNTWSLTQQSSDGFRGGFENYSFLGEGFTGFAWSTVNTQLVVAATAQSVGSIAVHAGAMNTFAGLYYSMDAGKTWQLAIITDDKDDKGRIIQTPNVGPSSTGNSATSVIWNPVRQRFYAAIRYHGYYESTDGITFIRLANQPGVNFTTGSTGPCPTNPEGIGSPTCPMYRGTIAVQPVTGDLFALTVDSNNQDQGLWHDSCSSTGSGCVSNTVTFANQISDAAIDTGGGSIIPQGDYNLSLVAVSSQQDTLLFVGTEDIFKCSVANSCAWRNTTNTGNCAAAHVASSQHAIDATAFGPLGLMYFGNDGGLWRTTDGIKQQQPPCSADDAAHFQNLNGGLGSLAEVGNFSEHPQDPNIFMAAMEAFGTAAPQGGSSVWSQILDGEGDFNAIDPENPQNWYATSAAPVSINACTQGTACNKSSFGLPEIGNAQVSNDGLGLTDAAPWILDPQNSANMVIGTCRVWRGPAANGSAWSPSNLLSPVLDGLPQGSFCNGNAQIQTLAASGSPSDAPGTPEQIYAGMAGSNSGGLTVAGHVYGASISSTATGPVAWSDLSNSPVTNTTATGFNPGGIGVSSIYVDPHDKTGKTIYVTLQGFVAIGSLVYSSTDGGAHWATISNNLPDAPANSIVVDPNDANTVYVALDTGVYVTRNIGQCSDSLQSCWSPFGTGLPNAPVTQLLAFNHLNTSLLRAATFGRGIWQVPLLTAGAQQASAILSPTSLTFADQQVTTTSNPQSITVTNNGSSTLNITSVTTGAVGAVSDFSEQNNCTQPIAPNGTCSIQVSFAPKQAGARQDVLTVFGNVSMGQVTASLSGTALPAGNIVPTPLSLNFGNVLVNEASTAQNITISNTGEIGVNLKSFAVTGDFQISANTCGASLAPDSGCTVAVTFTPTVAGPGSGAFSVNDDTGTQTVQLSGNGQAKPTAILSGASLSFSSQTVGTKSDSQSITLTNNGDIALIGIAVAVTGDFSVVNFCGTTLTGHSTCAIAVTYVPTQVGMESGVLTLTTALGVQTVTLSGTGIAPPGISSTPAIVNFGDQAVSSTSTSQVVTLTNNGGFLLNGLTFAVADTTADATANEYAITGSTCPADHTLGVGSTCQITVSFTPSQAGARNGSFTASAANLSAPLTVALTGTGEDFQIQVSSANSATIVNGQTATYQVHILPVNGSTGSVSLSCTGAPQNSTCTLSPAMTSLAVPEFSTVTVATGVGGTAQTMPAQRIWQRIGITLAVLLPCVFLGGRRRRVLLRAWLIGFVTLALMLPAACGTHASGGSTSTPTGPQGPTTPSGAYTINITASILGLQRSAQVKLTVQ